MTIEYKLLSPVTVADLNNHGRDGWEIVNPVVQQAPNDGVKFFTKEADQYEGKRALLVRQTHDDQLKKLDDLKSELEASHKADIAKIRKEHDKIYERLKAIAQEAARDAALEIVAKLAASEMKEDLADMIALEVSTQLKSRGES